MRFFGGESIWVSGNGAALKVLRDGTGTPWEAGIVGSVWKRDLRYVG